MIPRNKAEESALELVGEARRLRAAAEYSGSDEARWADARAASLKAWNAVVAAKKDIDRADVQLWDLRVAMLREARECAEAIDAIRNGR